MRPQLPLNAGRNAISGLLLVLILLFTLPLSAQRIRNFTTQQSGDWNNPSTWVDGNVPSNDIRNATVNITFDVVYSGGSNIVLRNNGTL
ncbi:MAG: hypothetical protein R3356_03105, partial [Eudoraea sp.]|nr:hypothetical protein [Eudoraea sp.]